MDIGSTIIEEMRRVAREQNKTMGAVGEDTPLLSTGLDSLCFAILVARLEETLGIDPFSVAEEVALPVTVGDLVAFYEHALV